MADATRKYKDFKIYACFVLNRLVSMLDIDLYQPDLEQNLPTILQVRQDRFLTKSDIRHEIRSNHHMTEKILEHLQEEGYVSLDAQERSYQVRITPAGVLHIRRFNEFYIHIYDSAIRDHYRYQDLPSWVTHGKG